MGVSTPGYDQIRKYGNKAEHHFPEVGRGVELLARFGYTSKGAVYAIIGILAVQAAIGAGGKITGSKGAIATIASQPFGQALLWLTAIGLVGYGIWRFVQAAKDTEDLGSEAKGIIGRTFFVVSGLLSVALAWFAANMAQGSESSGGSSSKALTAQVMEMPGGRWLVGLAGACILAVGIYQFIRAAKAKWMRDYESDMPGKQKRLAKRLGQYGLSARGVTFLIIGGFVIRAAWNFDPNQAKGLDAALASLTTQPFGTFLLLIVAIGLVAYALYCFSRARYRHFDVH